MQTFLPYRDFTHSAQVLDRQRLGKQRVETMQIMKALVLGVGWVNHPATKMWAGYESALLEYQEAVVQEWCARGYKDTCLEKTKTLYREHATHRAHIMPPWLGREDFHLAHQSNLLRKNPTHYEHLFPGVSNDLPYVWPAAVTQ